MTTHYHTPFSGVDDLNTTTFNSRLSDLDSAIYNLTLVGANTISVTLGEGVAIRNAGYIDLSDGQGYLLDADSSSPRADRIRGFWTATQTGGNTGTLQISGIMSGFAGLTVGDPVYVDTSAGDITQTRPSPTSGGSQVAIMEMGIAISATEIFISPQPVQYHMRDGLADTETLTIVHHGDARGYLRKVWAYITELEAGAEAEGYADSNQDEDVALRDQAPNTYGSDVCTGGTPSASSTAAGQPASNAFDDNTGTYWASAASVTSAVLKYDLGMGNEVTARQYTLRAHTADRDPEDWTFEGSNNDSDWDVLDTQSSVVFSSGEVKTYQIENATAYRYYRFNFTASSGANLHVAEAEIMEVDTYTDGPDKLAQTFTLSSETNVASVGLWLKKVGSPAGTCSVRIETVSGGDPTGTLVDPDATGSFAEGGLGSSYAEEVVSLADVVTLAAGTYAIVLSTDRSADEAEYIHWGADGSAPSYAGGEMLSESSAAWSSESKDAVFSVYQEGLTHPSRVSVDWWSSAYADMVNRYGDGSGADLDTQTTFKCVRAAGFDDVTVVVELP